MRLTNLPPHATSAGMAHNLATKGFSVTGYDLRPESLQPLVKAGGSAASSAADAAKDKPLLIIMTINDAQARAILFETGALEALAPDATVLLTSTISPTAAEQIAAEIARVRPDVGFVDAPVSGGQPGASGGTLTMMAGGSDENFAKVEPALRAMGTKIYHVGQRPGQGQSMKAINQVRGREAAALRMCVRSEWYKEDSRPPLCCVTSTRIRLTASCLRRLRSQ